MTREEAIYTLRGLFIPCASDGNKWGCDRNEALDMAIEALKAETEWIPCDTSGMPPEGEEVLVSNGRHIWIDESVAGDITEEGCMMWWGDGSDWIDTAWMPLPKPYREEREDYELATEQMEHDAMYEPTYNPEDGSM